MIKKNSSVFVCQSCDYQTAKWLGQCPDCKEWNTFEEELVAKKLGKTTTNSSQQNSSPLRLNEVKGESFERISTGVKEFDRVMGGGLVPGSLILVGGQPGIGKSTLLLEMVGRLAKRHHQDKFLYVSGEESPSQVAQRSNRIGIYSDNYYILHETCWQNILEQIKKIKPKYLVLDSIQTTVSSEIASPPGTVSQIREVTYELMNQVKANNITSFVIGHITKDGNIAGPKILEHMVDTVIYFEGDQFGHYRILRAIKNRFGNTNEVGIFEMQESGLKEVSNPGQYFLDDHLQETYGRALTCVIEGTRPLFVEIQSLVVENKFGTARRTSQGIDNNRVAMMVAIIEKCMELPIGMNDIYVNVVGGMRLNARESDLCVMASLLSSYYKLPVGNGVMFLGEVGLTGEVRSVPHMESRIKELSKMGYKTLFTSEKSARLYGPQFSEMNIVGLEQASELTTIFRQSRGNSQSDREKEIMAH